MKILLPDNQIMFTTQDAVQAICQYMFDELGFDHFSYRMYFDDGKIVHLSNNGKDNYGRSFLKVLYSEGVYTSIEDVRKLTNRQGGPACFLGFLTPQFSLPNTLSNRPVYQKQMEIAQSFNLKNRAMFFHTSVGLTEISTFGSSLYETIFFCNFCTQHLETLQNFLTYFKMEAKGLIETAKKNPIITPVVGEIPRLTKPPRMDFVGYDFKNKKKITLKLTNQEASTLKELVKGQTFKDAAKNLLISPRTVETHVYNAKMKSKCNSTNELLDLFSNLVCL